MAKKIFALIPSEREKECTHEHAPWSGDIPCTGVRRCTMCGTVVEEGRSVIASSCPSAVITEGTRERITSFWTGRFRP